ncbi:hypothetical protein DM01DRAFT_1404656 [Hesseltinella vesiculosa]|uniref:Uncharacterized protein n=1 Tax=Hesseltinella vesiculosa TaxID=101127 RepID=A0A1X2GSE4_9FUNG|nr:hypothetical protein DM01DRAFT_1404656 [Hesseltinella vesiculosa]
MLRPDTSSLSAFLVLGSIMVHLNVRWWLVYDAVLFTVAATQASIHSSPQSQKKVPNEIAASEGANAKRSIDSELYKSKLKVLCCDPFGYRYCSQHMCCLWALP